MGRTLQAMLSDPKTQVLYFKVGALVVMINVASSLVTINVAKRKVLKGSRLLAKQQGS